MTFDIAAIVLVPLIFAWALHAVFRNTLAGFLRFRRLLVADMLIAVIVIARDAVRFASGGLAATDARWAVAAVGVSVLLLLYALFGIRQASR